MVSAREDKPYKQESQGINHKQKGGAPNSKPKGLKIIFVGLHVETFLLLSKAEQFNIVAVNDTGYFNKIYGNPINLIGRCLYSLRRSNRFISLERFFLISWKILGRFSSSIYSRYKTYLKILSQRHINILDLSNKKSVLDYIRKENIDLIVVNTWDLLSNDIVDAPRYGSVNIHPSKLPQYRGALPTLWTLRNRDKESAITCLKIGKLIDGGDIIAQHSFTVQESDNWNSIEIKINEIIERTLVKDLVGYVEGDAIPKQQGHVEASYTAKYLNYMKINWNTENVRDIFNKVNLYPFLVLEDYCYTYLEKSKIKIRKCSVENNSVRKQPNGTFHVKGLRLKIYAIDGVLISNLFSCLSLRDSVILLSKRKGVFGTN